MAWCISMRAYAGAMLTPTSICLQEFPVINELINEEFSKTTEAMALLRGEYLHILLPTITLVPYYIL